MAHQIEIPCDVVETKERSGVPTRKLAVCIQTNVGDTGEGMVGRDLFFISWVFVKQSKLH